MSDEPVYREGLWDCPNCGNTNKGREIKCDGCGAARAEDVTFYLPDDAAVVADAEGKAIAAAGADWVCGFCETSNRAGVASCKQCGGDRAEGEARKQRVILDRPERPAAPAAPASTGKGAGMPIALIAVAIAALCSVCCIAAFVLGLIGSREEVVKVAEQRWERSIDVEDYRLVRDEGWSLPAGARKLREFEKQKGTERVQTGTKRVKVGTKDLGNGMFEDVFEDQPVYEERPVYATRYEYEYHTWKTIRTPRASGAGIDGMKWPELALTGKEREKSGSRKQTLIVTVRTPAGDEYDYTAKDEAEYGRLAVGTEWVARITLGSVKQLLPPGGGGAKAR